MDAEFWKDVAKLLVDKGLLALIVAGAAYYLNRAIERYRATNTYAQKLAEAQFEAYKTIARTIGEQHLQIHRVVTILADDKDKRDPERWAAELVTAWREIIDSYLGQTTAISANMIFCSDDVAALLVQFQSAYADFRGAFQTEPDDDSVTRLAAAVRELQQWWPRIGNALTREVHRNPFATEMRLDRGAKAAQRHDHLQ